ncbi:Exoglucanase 1 [Grifola frondosa]|uniref:Glucanase n=1 Tax=Grifola frondosa TaxID=5627 RepID=A0A1C7MPY0_GRIFR|nr:Exoglucanase 1 [Grifola frondosa]
MFPTASLVFSLLAIVYGQQIGTQVAETHHQLTFQQCTMSGCTTLSMPVVVDSNWCWLHSATGYTNCYTSNTWNVILCPDPVACVQNCTLDSGTYGITTSGDALTLKFVTGSNVSSCMYLMASDTSYQMFKLKNQEFAFNVDIITSCRRRTELILTGALRQEIDWDDPAYKVAGSFAT